MIDDRRLTYLQLLLLLNFYTLCIASSRGTFSRKKIRKAVAVHLVNKTYFIEPFVACLNIS